MPVLPDISGSLLRIGKLTELQTRFLKLRCQKEQKNLAEDAMTRDCASCRNFTSKEYLDDYLARACGNTYCGLCRLKSDPARGAFILRVQYQDSCRDWEAEEMLLAA